MRSNILFPHYTIHEREAALKNMAAKMENGSYTRSLDEEEINREKDKNASIDLNIKALKEEMKSTAESMKAKLKSLQAQKEETVEKIRTGKEDVTGKLYGVSDMANGKIVFYDVYGEIIKSRDLAPDERQRRLFENKGTEADGEALGGDITINPVTIAQYAENVTVETSEGAANVTVNEPAEEGVALEGVAETGNGNENLESLNGYSGQTYEQALNAGDALEGVPEIGGFIEEEVKEPVEEEGDFNPFEDLDENEDEPFV